MDGFEQEFNRICDKAAAILPGFKRPSLDWKSLTGNTAGRAHYRECKVCLNRAYCMSNPKDMLEDTIPHEVAHILAFQLHGQSCHHDQRWKDCFKMLTGGKTPSRLHDYGSSKAAMKRVESFAERLLRELGE